MVAVLDIDIARVEKGSGPEGRAGRVIALVLGGRATADQEQALDRAGSRDVEHDYRAVADRLRCGGGLSFDFWVNLPSVQAGQTILDSRRLGSPGVRIFTLDRGRIRIEIRDDQGGAGWWDSDPDHITAVTVL